MIDRATEERRLAKVLGREHSDLAYLQAVSAEHLAELRQAIQNTLLDEFKPIFSKMAASGKLVPNAISALICHKVFGPTLTANMSYYTPAKLAADMCSHFSESFMTEVARDQVPERAQALLEGLPVDLMRGVTRNLLASGDYYIMGGFTDFMPEDKVMALMAELDDPRDSLRVSSYAQHKDRIARIAMQLPDDELKELVVTGIDHDEFLTEIVLVTAAIPAEHNQRIVAVFANLSAEQQQRALGRARELGATINISILIES